MFTFILCTSVVLKYIHISFVTDMVLVDLQKTRKIYGHICI